MKFLAYEIILKEIEFIKKQMIGVIKNLDQHKHLDAGKNPDLSYTNFLLENELENYKTENKRVMSKYLEIKDENKEILSQIQKISKFFVI